MKKLNFVWALVLGAVVYLSSCNMNNVAPAIGDSAILDMMFLATTGDSTNAFRDHKGHCDLTEIAITDLPSAITDYVNTNYAGSTIERAGSHANDGNIAVLITLTDGTKTGLLFDSAGAFIKELVRHMRGGTPVDVADLPSAITDYLAANYAAATIEKAMTGPDGKYRILLVLADSSYLGVGFNADGSFIGEVSLKDKMGKKHGKGGKGGRGH